MMAHRVAALYVDARGCYVGIPWVDAWDIARDARRYPGRLPVVVHPPCQLWVNFAHLNYSRWGGEHNRPGNDGGCFAAALASIRQWGGVLEHPAGSNAWSEYGLLRPTGLGWQHAGSGEWVCEVWQSAYGHLCRKRTWLLYSGHLPPTQLRWDRRPGTHQIGGFDRIKPTLSKRHASATPVEFRDALLNLALHSAARTSP